MGSAFVWPCRSLQAIAECHAELGTRCRVLPFLTSKGVSEACQARKCRPGQSQNVFPPSLPSSLTASASAGRERSTAGYGLRPILDALSLGSARLGGFLPSCGFFLQVLVLPLRSGGPGGSWRLPVLPSLGLVATLVHR